MSMPMLSIAMGSRAITKVVNRRSAPGVEANARSRAAKPPWLAREGLLVSSALMLRRYEPDWRPLGSNSMPIQWAGLSPELLLPMDRARPEPLRSQLEAALREAIRSGRLGVGERLPSSREMARELGVSRGLVQECY